MLGGKMQFPPSFLLQGAGNEWWRWLTGYRPGSY